MIEVEGLTRTYGAFAAVRDVTFRVGRGEVVGFLGPNGAGKTTTLKVLTGFLAATAGRVVVAGHDVAREPFALRRKLGYLAEHNPLYTDMTAGAFLDHVGRLRGIAGRDRRERVARVAARTGTGRVLEQPIADLSKGYRQRVGLAAALLHDPEVLVLDEPTSGLDPLQVQEIRGLVREVGATRTVLFSTHLLAEVEATCRRAIVIREGRLVADGPIADLRAGAARGAVRVRFRPGAGDLPAPPALAAAVAALPLVARVAPLADGALSVEPALAADRTGVPSGAAAAGAREDLAAALFRFAVEQRLSLVELAPREASLEEVFLALAAAPAGASAVAPGASAPAASPGS